MNAGGSIHDAKKLQVVLVTRWFPPQLTGAAIRFLRYCPGLTRRGIELSVLAPGGRGLSSQLIDLDTKLSSGIANTVSMMLESTPIKDPAPAPSRFLSEIAFGLAAARHFRRVERLPEVVHFLSPSTYMLPTMAVLRGHGAKLVVSATLLSPFSKNRFRAAAQKSARRGPFAFADATVAQTRFARSFLRRAGVNGKIEVIPNGVDLTRFRPPQSKDEKRLIRENLGLGSSKKVVAFVGALIERKGIDTLFDAWTTIFRKRADAMLLLVGPTFEEFRMWATSRARPRVRFGLDDSRVRCTGMVENVEEYLRAADILLFASYREGMPNAVLEALASGLPVVLTPFLGLSRELGRTGREYLMCRRSGQDFANVAMDLLDDDAMRRRLAVNARNWAREHFDIEESLDRYASLYRLLEAKKDTGAETPAIRGESTGLIS